MRILDTLGVWVSLTHYLPPSPRGVVEHRLGLDQVVERGVVDESRLALASPRGEVTGPLRADPRDVRGEAGGGEGGGGR